MIYSVKNLVTIQTFDILKADSGNHIAIEPKRFNQFEIFYMITAIQRFNWIKQTENERISKYTSRNVRLTGKP